MHLLCDHTTSSAHRSYHGHEVITHCALVLAFSFGVRLATSPEDVDLHVTIGMDVKHSDYHWGIQAPNLKALLSWFRSGRRTLIRMKAPWKQSKHTRFFVYQTITLSLVGHLCLRPLVTTPRLLRTTRTILTITFSLMHAGREAKLLNWLEDRYYFLRHTIRTVQTSSRCLLSFPSVVSLRCRRVIPRFLKHWRTTS